VSALGVNKSLAQHNNHIHNSDENTYVPTGRSRKVLLNGGSNNTDQYNNLENYTGSNNVQVHQPGQAVPSNTNFPTNPYVNNVTYNTQKNNTLPITSGIIKNISTDIEKKTFLSKWMRTVFSGVPYSKDNSITTFQVYPDYSGTSLNALGNACDQVIVYGKMTAGVISDNNDVEVFGTRNSDNAIIANTIRNVAAGTQVSADTISPTVVRLVTLLVASVIIGILYFIFTMTGMLSAGVVVIIIALIALFFLFRNTSGRYTKLKIICIVGVGVAAVVIFFPNLITGSVGIIVFAGAVYLIFKFLIKPSKKR